jgi:cyclophilin family peptidyl-prolyl cis-trans isomerase/HEAT repeat protein
LIALALLLLPVLFGPGGPSRIERLTHIATLEDQRSGGGGELDRYLRDPDRGVRRRAALAAGRIGESAFVPTLIELMNDNEPEVRQMAAFALGQIGDKLAVERLVASLKDPEPVVRGRAAEALGKIGEVRVAPDVGRMVLSAIPKGAPLVTVRGDDPGSPQDPWLELRLGLLSLARLKDPATAGDVLFLDGKPRFDWWAATYVAMRVGGPAMKPLLLQAATSSDPLSRSYAARGLGELKDPSVVERLCAMTTDKDEWVAVAALRALVESPDSRGTAAAAALLASPSATLRGEALRAIAALPVDVTLKARVVPLVGSDQAFIRAAALQALAHVGREEFALVLSGLDPDPDFSVRAALATALAEAGDEMSLGHLFAMLKDEDPRVLPSVLLALKKARGNDAAETLKRSLPHPDFAVRAAAAEALGGLKAPGISAALQDAYKKALGDPEADARLAEIKALGLQKDDIAKTTLADAARGDPSRLVREAAGRALRSLGAEAPAPGPEAVVRPYVDYREAMLPYDPIPGVPLFTPRAFIHTRKGTIEIYMDVVQAPLTTASFVTLARRGFFNGLTFHRVVPGYVIQGGDPRGDGNGGPGYTLRCEIGERPYGRGAVGMALDGKDTGGSQFFITHVPTPQLDGGYTLFGWVVTGMDVVNAIQQGDAIERIEIWDGR